MRTKYILRAATVTAGIGGALPAFGQGSKGDAYFDNGFARVEQTFGVLE